MTRIVLMSCMMFIGCEQVDRVLSPMSAWTLDTLDPKQTRPILTA